jgi:hypothetical protein
MSRKENKKKKAAMAKEESKPVIKEVKVECYKLHFTESLVIMFVALMICVIPVAIYDGIVNHSEKEIVAYVERLVDIGEYYGCVIIWEEPHNPAKGIIFEKLEHSKSRFWYCHSRNEIPKYWYADRNFKVKIRYNVGRNEEVYVVSIRKVD